MKIGLVDVDSTIPNLALMKISAHHKSLGHSVEWYSPMFAIMEPYDIVYLSKVFSSTYTSDYHYPIYSKKVIKGGYGYDNYDIPFENYDTIFPDYSIYFDIYPKWKHTAFGNLTRGCPRNCSFCIVSNYEGKVCKQVATLDTFFDPKVHDTIELLDSNILAHKSLELLKSLRDSGAHINFTGGTDIRFLTREQAKIINETKVDRLCWAWDNDDNGKTESMLIEKRSWFKFDERIMQVYVLVNYNTTWEFDLYRVDKIAELDYIPYIMIYDKPNAEKKYVHLQRVVNNRMIWGANRDKNIKELLDEYEKHKDNLANKNGQLSIGGVI